MMELRDYVVLLRRRGWMVALALVLSLLGAHLVTGAVTPRYEAATSVFVGGSGDEDPEGNPIVESGPALQDLARSYAEFARSGSVRRDAERRLGRPIRSVTASAVKDTQILRISSSATSARDAAAQANALATSLIEAVERQPVRRQAQLAVLDAATPPAKPVTPRPELNLVLAGVLGLLLGFAAALGAERLDRRVRQGRDSELPSPLPALGRVPKLSRSLRSSRAVERHEDSRVAEPYRRLAAAVDYRCRGTNAKLLVVTSPARGEGKTTVAAQLALTLAEEGKRVALVELDLRRPDLARHFVLESQAGFCEALLGGEQPQPVHLHPGFEIYPAGTPSVQDARQLISSPKLARFVRGLRERFDYVLLDTPPVLALADAGLLAQKADGALLVMREGQTSLEEVEQACAALSDLGAQVLGLIANEAPEPGGGYGYYAPGPGRLRRMQPPRRREHDRAKPVKAARRQPRRRLPSLRSTSLSRRTKLALAVSFVVVLVLAASTSFALISGARGLSQGLAALDAGRFDEASKLLSAAQTRLGFAGALVTPAAAILGWAGPLGDNLRSAETLAGAGQDLAAGGRSLADAGTVASREGLTGEASPLLDAAAAHFHEARYEAAGADRPGSLVLTALGTAQRDLSERTKPMASRAGTAAALAGFAEKRGRYLLVIQNNAELRATGGLVGAFGVIDTSRGDLRLVSLDSDTALGDSTTEVEAPAEFDSRYGRFGARRTWANANMSPDFATSARVMLGLYERDTAERLGGVVAIDAIGLSLLLEASGPVRAGGLRLDGDTFVREALSEAYRRPVAVRTRTLLAGARAGWRSLGAPDDLSAVAGALSDATDQGHLRAYAVDPGLQRKIVRGELDGSVDAPGGDYLMVVRQNAGANKLDYHLSSTMRYDVRLAKDGTGKAELRVTVKNSAPEAGLPDYVLGRRLPGDPAGLARSWFSAYSPADAAMMGFAGPEGSTAESGEELRHSVRSWFHAASPGASALARLRLRLPRVVDEEGNYRLTVQRQATLGKTRLVVRVNGRNVYDGALRRDLELATPAKVPA